MIPLALQHDIHKRLECRLIVERNVDNIIADSLDTVDTAAELLIPGHLPVTQEHPSGDQLYSIIIDLVLVLEILVKRGTGKSALLCNQ